MKKFLLILIVIGAVYGAMGMAIIKHERSKIQNYLIYDANESEYIVSYNKGSHKVEILELQDNVTLKNETTKTYLNNKKELDINVYKDYINSTFGIKISEVIDVSNKDYEHVLEVTEISFIKEDIVKEMEEISKMINGDIKYQPEQNVELLRVASEIQLSTNGEMNKKELSRLKAEGVTDQDIYNSYVDELSAEVICNEDNICSFDKQDYKFIIDSFKGNARLKENIYIEDSTKYREINQK